MTESAEEKNSALAIDTVVTAAVATTALVIDTGSSDEDEVQRLLPMSGARSRLISSRCPCSSSRSCWVLRRCAFLASCVIAVLGIELGLFVHYMDKNELGGYMSSLDRLFPNAFTGQYTYIESSRYARDRLLNQDWVAANAGQVPSARAPHWKAMPLPGRTHLLLTRLLGAWSNIAESHHLPWSMMGGTLLGYLRHGDFIPHDHDIDLVIAAEVDVTRLAAALPPDMCLTSNVLGPGHVPGWPGYKVEFRAPRYPLGADMGPISPVPFMDLFLYNTSAPLSNKGAFMGASFHPDRVHPFRESRVRMMGSTLVRVARNATAFLAASIFNKNMDQLPNYLDVPLFRCTRRMLEYEPIDDVLNPECALCVDDLGWKLRRWTSPRQPEPEASWLAAQCVSPAARP